MSKIFHKIDKFNSDRKSSHAKRMQKKELMDPFQNKNCHKVKIYQDGPYNRCDHDQLLHLYPRRTQWPHAYIS